MRVTAAVGERDRREQPRRPAPTAPAAGSALAALASLAVAEWRGTPRLLPAVAGAAGLLLAAATRLSGPANNALACLFLVRCAVLAAGVGLAFLLDDPARHTTATAPVRPAVRMLLRLAPAGPALAGWWTLVLLLVPGRVRPPAGALSLEAVAVAALALGTAVLTVRGAGRAEPGRTAAAALVFLAAVALVLPHRWELLPGGPLAPDWQAAHRRWAAVLAAGLTAVALGLPEPLRRHRATLKRPSRNRG